MRVCSACSLVTCLRRAHVLYSYDHHSTIREFVAEYVSQPLSWWRHHHLQHQQIKRSNSSGTVSPQTVLSATDDFDTNEDDDVLPWEAFEEATAPRVTVMATNAGGGDGEEKEGMEEDSSSSAAPPPLPPPPLHQPQSLNLALPQLQINRAVTDTLTQVDWGFIWSCPNKRKTKCAP